MAYGKCGLAGYELGRTPEETNDAATPLRGLFAAGECACVSINGANRLGSNSLAEILVFGARAGRSAAAFAKANPAARTSVPGATAAAAQARLRDLFMRDP